MRRRRVTSADVAQLAGVSRSAVSRTFTPGASVSTDTRTRVTAAATELGYRRNALAAGLTKNSSDLVALVTRDLSNPFESHLCTFLAANLKESGQRPLLVHALSETDVGPELLDALAYPVAGAIIAGGSVSAKTVTDCMGLGIPIVLSGRVPDTDPVDVVTCDNEAGVRAAVEALVRADHRRIAYIGGPVSLSSEIERSGALQRALAERGQQVHAEAHGDFLFESGYRAALDILRGDRRPDAIFCCNDAMALGAMDAARYSVGLRVPDDLSIVGFDDVPMAAWPSYQLTTVRNPVEELAEELVALLARRIAAPGAPSETRRLRPILVRRSSARLLPAAAPVTAPEAAGGG